MNTAGSIRHKGKRNGVREDMAYQSQAKKANPPRLITAHCSLQMQHFGKGALRVAKNYTKGYSDTQAKVRDATSNDPWGPSGTQMNEIAQLTYNQFRCRTHLPFYLSDSLPYFQNRLRGDYGNAG